MPMVIFYKIRGTFWSMFQVYKMKNHVLEACLKFTKWNNTCLHKNHWFNFLQATKGQKMLNLISCKLKKAQKRWLSVFTSLKTLKKMNLIFCNIKKLKSVFFEADKSLNSCFLYFLSFAKKITVVLAFLRL